MSPMRYHLPAPETAPAAPARQAPVRATGRTSAATGGRPAAAGDLVGLLRQLQRGRGNQYVQRLVDRDGAAAGTGIPDGIKTSLERRSGVDLSGVRVYYNSPRPAGFGALAYTQGEEIHVAPGQEAHLAHEAWHVVQQRQGRVRATHTEAGIALNEDAGLEREADRARHASLAVAPGPALPTAGSSLSAVPRPGRPAPVQLDRGHVGARLLDYRKGDRAISDDDLAELLTIFQEWAGWQQKADDCGGKWPAGTYRYNAIVMITKDLIETINDSDDISLPVRRILVRLWNKDTDPEDQVTFTEPELDESEAVDLGFGILPSWAPLSPYADRYTYDPVEMSDMSLEPESPLEKEDEGQGSTKQAGKESSEDENGRPVKRRRRKSRTLVTDPGKSAREDDIPVVDTAHEASLIIRSFTKREENIPRGFKFMWGPGLFEKTGFEDIVYSQLTEAETGGSFFRSGSVESWNEILGMIPDSYLQNPARFFHHVQAVLRGQPTQDPILGLVAGAMISDVKHGIGEWMQLLSELYPLLTKPMKETDLQSLFKTWYEYSGKGGRDQRERRHRPSYREEEARVRTTDSDRPTLIPSRGGYNFENATVPWDSYEWQIIVEQGDPLWLWNLAMTNRFFCNLVAARYRRTRGLLPK